MIVYNVRDLYDNIDLLQNGDTLLVSRSGNLFNAFSAKIIQWATSGQWNHAALLVIDKNAEDKISVIEADTSLGNVKRSIDLYDDSMFSLLVMRPILTKDSKPYTKTIGKAVITDASKYLGLKYDFTALAWFAMEAFGKGIFNRLSRRVFNPLQLNNRFFCSEYVTQSYRNCNVNICNGIATGSVSPNDIFRDALNNMEIVDLRDTYNQELMDYNAARKFEIKQYLKNLA